MNQLLDKHTQNNGEFYIKLFKVIKLYNQELSLY